MTDEADPADAGGETVRDAVLNAFETHGVELPEDIKAEAPSQEARTDGRDQRGRFATRSEGAPKEAAPDDKVEKTENVEKPLDTKPISGTDKPDEKTQTPSTADAPPIGWPADAKSEWSKLSPAIQAAVVKRENEINEGGRRWSEEKRRYEDTLAPARAIAKRYGVDERESIQRLVTAAEFMDRDPVKGLHWMAKSYGLDLKQLADASAQAPRVDPALQALHRELTQLKQTVTQREQLAEATEKQEIDAEISHFAKDHPHFQDVKVTMGRLMEAGEAGSLDEAYEKACWASKPVREKLQTERETNLRSDREKAERERVDKARRGAVSINGSPLGQPVSRPAGNGSVRDDVLAAWNQHAGRA